MFTLHQPPWLIHLKEVMFFTKNISVVLCSVYSAAYVVILSSAGSLMIISQSNQAFLHFLRSNKGITTVI